MFIGRVNSEQIIVETNVTNFNPLISSAMLLPIADSRGAKKMDIPYRQTPILSNHALENFYQFLLKGPSTSPLGLQIDWSDRQDYKIPDLAVQNSVALKVDGLVSTMAYHKFSKNKNIKINPFGMSYTVPEYDDMKSWAKSIGIEKLPMIQIDYGKWQKGIVNMDRYENWISSCVASNKSNVVWLGMAYPEISNYIPDRTEKMFTDGSNWLSRIMERRVVIEVPFAKDETRTDIVKQFLSESTRNIVIVQKAMRCQCGMCFECFMNTVVSKNLDLSTTVKFKNEEMIKRIRKLIDLNKLNPRLVDEITQHVIVST